MKLFKRIDRRLANELKGQRQTIVKGLICVLLTSLLTTLTIPVVELAVNSISEASLVPMAVQSSKDDPALTWAKQRGYVPVKKAQEKESPKSEEIRREAVSRLGWISLLVVGIFAIKYWFTRGQTYYLTKASVELSTNLRERIFKKLQKLPISYFNEKRTGNLQSVLTNDVNVYQNAIFIVRDSIDGPFKAVTAFITVLYMQWQLALICMFFVPIVALVIQRNGRKVRQAQAKVQDDVSNVAVMTHEALQGTRVIKAFAAEASVAQSYDSLVEESRMSQLKAARRIASLRPLVELIGAMSLASVLYVCGWLAFGGQLRVSEIIALTLAMDVINQGFRTLGYVNSTFNQVQAAADRIYSEVLDVPDERTVQPGSKTIDRPVGRIDFRDVSFVYADGTKALDSVSFTIEPGTSLALVGPSGAGKSTIADLLLRFYDPTSGTIHFDGVDTTELDIGWLRKQMGVVPQQTFLFAQSITENIKLGKPEATEADIFEASKAAHASGFIEKMPEGYETVLGERGIRISGGEMQRIAIARALVRKPTVLLLDEATSNLDSVSEKAVQQALEEIMSTRTTLFIAHRLSTAARATKILMLRRGQVLEYGTHSELMGQKGAYAGMYQAFSSGVLDETIG